MLLNRNFQTAVFILSYRGDRVARITYIPTGAPNSLSTNTTKALLQTPKNTNTTSIHSLHPPNYPHLEVSFRLTGSAVTVYEIFFLALDMLREVSPFRRTARLVDATTTITAANLNISTRQTDPPRTAQDPPYFQVEWLMRALAKTPAYMLERRSFREVEMGLFIDEVKVGEVSIRRPRTGVGLVSKFSDLFYDDVD